MTPRALALRGLLLIGAFLVCHALGLRDYLPLICGSPAPSTLPRGVQAVCCSAYLFTYLAAVLLAPVLLIAAAILALRK